MTYSGVSSIGEPVAWKSLSYIATKWSRVSESPEWIAGAIDAITHKASELWSINDWRTSRAAWPDEPALRSELVRAHVMRDDDGEPSPLEGYSVRLVGSCEFIRVALNVWAGSPMTGEQIPFHSASMSMTSRNDAIDWATSDTSNVLCDAMIDTFQPMSLSHSTGEIGRELRDVHGTIRGGWKVGIGYRVWVHDSVGTFQHVTNDALTIRRVGDGTMLTAPDRGWQASDIIDHVLPTLAINDIDEIPH